MAIISAAIAAVAAAVATTTVATVATAAIAVGTLVGTVGLGISVIGMATGNATLSKIGGYLGMAGGVMGLAGGLAGGMAGYAKTLSTAWDDGVGSLFSSTKPVGQEALGRGIVAGTNKQAMSHYQSTGQTLSEQGVRAGALNPPPTGTLPSPDLSLDQMSRFVGPDDIAAAGRAQKIQSLANADPLTASVGSAPTAPSAVDALSSVTSAANIAPTVGAGPPAAAASTPSRTAGFFAGMPDWAKAQMAISGAQGLAGMLGGWFESATAEEKLDLERQAQEWRMRHEDKNQSFTQRNASAAPLVEFKGSGMINRGATS